MTVEGAEIVIAFLFLMVTAAVFGVIAYALEGDAA